MRQPGKQLAMAFVTACPVLLAAAVFPPAQARGQEAAADVVEVTQIAPRFYSLSQRGANLVVYVDADASVVAGVHTPPLVARARELITSIDAPPVAFAVMMENDSAAYYGDAGWRELGAVTVAHERLNARIQGARSEQASRAAAELRPIRRATVGFSHVVQLNLEHDEVHIVHDYDAATDAEVIVHFEEAGVLVLGAMFNNDGYPDIDLDRGGSLDDTVKWFEWFSDGFTTEKLEPIVPGRGSVATLARLRSYLDMLRTVRNRVTALRNAGKTVEEVIATRPTADLDRRWGGGPISPDAFVRMVYESLSAP